MKKTLWIVLDLVMVAISLLIAIAFYNIHPSAGLVSHMLCSLPLLTFLTVLSLHFSGVYKAVLRYVSLDMVAQVLVSTLLATGITYIVSLVAYLAGRGRGPDGADLNLFLMPRPIYLMQWLLAVLLIAGSRLVARLRANNFNLRDGLRSALTGGGRDSGAKRILVIGAGYAGATVIRDIQNGRYGGRAVAVLDDDPARQGSAIHRVPVVGGTAELASVVEKDNITDIIIAIATPQGDISDLINSAFRTGAHVQIYSGVHEEARDLNIADLLGRPETKLSTDGEYFQGKVVLITGGGGSIGSELARQVLACGPSRLILYDISENYMYDLLFELRETYGALVNNTVVLEVGSVRDEESLWRVMGKYRPEIVIHAAAHKHVPLMETSAEQAILNNVFGTYKTAKVAAECGVKRFVLISTDKAVNPTNVMGASKRLAEIVLSAMPKGKMEAVAVRFGNVLGSHGSVVPIFERQIKAGGPVTITDPNIIRYFMTIPEAASLVLQAASIAKGGELFILDMGEPVKIKDLAETMIRLYGTGREEIVYTGLRPGEKLYEELLLDKENDRATERDRIYVTKQDRIPWTQVEQWLHMLEDGLERKRDVRQMLSEILPTYHPANVPHQTNFRPKLQDLPLGEHGIDVVNVHD